MKPMVQRIRKTLNPQSVGIAASLVLLLGLGMYGATLPRNLHEAAARHDLALLILLSLGEDPNQRDPLGKTPLFYASSLGRTQLLTERGADVHLTDQAGASPLHQAARNGLAEVAQGLIEAGADVNAEFGSGGIPLHFAAWQGDLPLTQLLLDKGSEVNRADGYGLTPLAIALDLGHQEVATLLRQYGGLTSPESLPEAVAP
ncbi:MAG: ankyrin repeat domain-containing protein [Cyanobacteriota bacterium]|nr:ankyrin repeat domain-containing protein [Cyanobacteriota bacterium]